MVRLLSQRLNPPKIGTHRLGQQFNCRLAIGALLLYMAYINQYGRL